MTESNNAAKTPNQEMRVCCCTHHREEVQGFSKDRWGMFSTGFLGGFLVGVLLLVTALLAGGRGHHGHHDRDTHMRAHEKHGHLMMDREMMGREMMGREMMGREMMGREMMDREMMGEGPQRGMRQDLRPSVIDDQNVDDTLQPESGEMPRP